MTFSEALRAYEAVMADWQRFSAEPDFPDSDAVGSDLCDRQRAATWAIINPPARTVAELREKVLLGELLAFEEIEAAPFLMDEHRP
jgi:hypothetical protein